MKKINELLSLRADKIAKMDELSKNENLTEEQANTWESLRGEVEKLDKDINILKTQDQLNRSIASNKVEDEKTEEKTPLIGESFREFLVGAVEGNGSRKFELRADPIITSTDADIINKSVANGIDILKAPAQEFLTQLGVTMYTGLTGNFAVPSMDEDLATFPGEDASAASANMTPDSLVLAARRVTHTQSITRETLAQTNPGVYASIVQNLVNGVWKAVTNDVFDTLETDAATQIKTTGASITYQNILDMEASVGNYVIANQAYVTTPTGKSFLKGLNASSAGIKFVWEGNEMNGYPAYGVPSANSNRVYFGDWSKQVVGQWGGLEIIVDPYSNAKKGLINLTAVGLFDTGCANKRAFAILDASTY